MMYSSDDGANGTNALTPEEFFGEAEDDEDAESSVEKKSEVNAGDVIPVNDATPAQIENAKREFKYGLDKLSPEDLAEVMNNVFGRIAVSLQRQELAGGGPDVEHDRKEVEKAFRRMKALIQKDRDNFAMKDPETQKDIMHGLTAEEREEFANLVYRYWYDWLRAAKKTEDGEIVEVPLMQIKDWLSTPDMEIRKDPKTGELKYKTNAQFVGPGYSYMPIGVGYDTAFRTRDENGTLRQPAVVWKEKPLKTDIKRAERIASKEKQDAIDRGEYAPEEIDTLVNTWKKTFGPVSKKVR